MAHLGVHAGPLGRVECLLEGRDLLAGLRGVRDVRAGEVGPDAHHVDVRRCHRGIEELRPRVGRTPPAPESRVEFQVHACDTSGGLRGRGYVVQHAEASCAQVDIGGHAGHEVRVAGCVEPREDAAGVAGCAQAEGLRRQRHSEPGDTNFAGCTSDLHRPVAVGVGLDDDHARHLRAAAGGTREEVEIRSKRSEVDQRFGTSAHLRPLPRGAPGRWRPGSRQ